jgi:TatA/E family protein of Tat protein translocase
MFFGWTEILLIGGLLAIVFWKGPGRISGVMKDMAGGVRAFRDGLKTDAPPPSPTPPPAAPPVIEIQPPVRRP